MSGWSTNITEAQTGDYVWLATEDGKVLKSYWVFTCGHGYGFWGVPKGENPVAWQPYPRKPIHPFELAKQEEAAE